MHKCIWSWWATGYINIYRQKLVYSLHYTIYIIHTTRIGAGAHGDHPPRFHHLFMKTFDDGRHLDKDSSGYDHHISFARCSSNYFGTKTCYVIFRSHAGSHFNKAAGEPKMKGPH